MKTVRLKNKANRSKNLVDIGNYKKQHNLFVSLNFQAKSRYFSEVPSSEKSRTFRDT